jgi:hypothetical protein
MPEMLGCVAKVVCVTAVELALAIAPRGAAAGSAPKRNVYFGDTHAHSMFSGDAFGFGNQPPPETAYRLARGDEVEHVGGYKVMGKDLRDPDKKAGGPRFLFAMQAAAGSGSYPEGYTPDATKTIWKTLVDMAENYYEPGTMEGTRPSQQRGPTRIST